MNTALEIDPILREYLELRRGLSGGEIDRLLVEWNQQGSLTDFLASKALLDRTMARLLVTAQKGYLSSTPDEIRTALGIKLRPRNAKNADSQPAAAPAVSDKERPETQPDPTPPTQPPIEMGKLAPSKETERSEPKERQEPKDIASAPSAQPAPQPAAEGSRPRKSGGRRGFLGASEEELRHILGTRQSDPAPQPRPETAAIPAAVAPAAVAPAAVAPAAVAPAAVAPADVAPAALAPAAVAPPAVAPPAVARSPVASDPTPSAAAPAAKPAKLASVSLSSNSVPSHSDPQIRSSAHSGQDLDPMKSPGPRAEPKVGAYLDRYYLEESLGEGATATIFRSFHKLLRIPVAIKCYKREAMADDPIGAQRFLSEAQILIRLEHPNIVRVLDIVDRDGAPYIVFEYVGELSLQGMIQNMGHLPPLRVAQIGAQVAAALDVASNNGLLHRDVKPDNILIRKDGLAKLADFGIATHRSSDGRTADELARRGLISGTPQYISPEQITTPDQIDFRADMYSLGATLYHAASGHPPFERDSIDELLHAQLEDQPVPLITLDPNFDVELSEMIDRMLLKEPVDRFASLTEIRKRLEVVSSRIQGEVSQRRRNAMSSGAMPMVSPNADGSRSGSTPDDSAKGSNPGLDRAASVTKKQSSGSHKQAAADSLLMPRESSSTLRLMVVAIAVMMASLVIYVLIRTSH